MKRGLFFVLFSISTTLSNAQPIASENQELKPWTKDARYWQYKGEPILLLGGSKTDHLFLADNLLAHLNEIQEVGGNYVRNTMSQREDIHLKPYALQNDGTFNLDQWNTDYWSRFENMLKWTNERNIIVQIEVWDRFDYSRDFWDISPWNPGMNSNYSYEETGLSEVYPKHPSSDEHPFFHSIPGMPRYYPKLDKIRGYQEAFVSKMLSYSLKYDNVLYCMNNETTTPIAWGQYWIDFIQAKAAEKGVQIYTTDMFDDAHLGEKAMSTPTIFKNGQYYQFADISQVNSRNFDDDHWQTLLYLLSKVNETFKRPSNHTKIYGGGYKSFGTGGQEDGVERFWRNILAGSASSRFHRPDSGNGLNEKAKASIKAMRLLESKIKLWNIEPQMQLLTERLPNEAYVSGEPGKQYVVYFPYGGSIGLDLSRFPEEFQLQWISITEGNWLTKSLEIILGGKIITVTAPFKGGWAAVITKAEP